MKNTKDSFPPRGTAKHAISEEKALQHFIVEKLMKRAGVGAEDCIEAK